MKKCRDCSRDWQSLCNFYDMVFDLQFLLQCLHMLNRYNPNRQITISITTIANPAHFYNHFYRLAIPYSTTISILIKFYSNVYGGENFTGTRTTTISTAIIIAHHNNNLNVTVYFMCYTIFLLSDLIVFATIGYHRFNIIVFTYPHTIST